MPTICAVSIDVLAVYEGKTHLEWAAGVASSIARARGFAAGSQEEAELVAVSHAILARRVRTFDPSQVPAGGSPDGQFRGWVHPSIKWECLREARRLRGGGISRCYDSDGGGPARIEPLPDRDEELEDSSLVVPEWDGGDGGDRLPPVVEVVGEVEPPKPVAAWHGCGRCGNRAKLRPHEPRVCVRCGAALSPVRVCAGR